MQAINMLIADDQPCSAAGFRLWAENMKEVAKVCFTEKAEEVIALIKKEDINFLVLDIEFDKQPKGLWLLPKLKKQFPALKILIQTMLADDVYFHAVGTDGVFGIIAKTANEYDFKNGVRQIWQTSQFFCCSDTKKFLAQYEQNKTLRINETETKYLYLFSEKCNYRLIDLAVYLERNEKPQKSAKTWENSLKKDFANLRELFDVGSDTRKLFELTVIKAALLKYNPTQ